MPTNDERRRIATRLRKAWITGCQLTSFFELDCDDFKNCQECSEYCTKYLADLIEPEPECVANIIFTKEQQEELFQHMMEEFHTNGCFKCRVRIEEDA